MCAVKQIKVNAIKNGTVIDHIPAGKVLRLIELLNLSSSNTVMIGMNLHSEKLGCKDIFKIENRELTEQEVQSLALLAPQASVIIIKDFEVSKKINVEIPNYVENILLCPNEKCITNMEGIPTKFNLLHNSTVKVRCTYCEKKYQIDEVNFRV